MSKVFGLVALSALVLVSPRQQPSGDPVLFVAEASGRVSQYTLSGTSLGTFTTIPGQAAGLAVHDQTLYVADYYSGNIVRPFAADGTPLPTLSPGLGLYGTSGMAFDAAGNLFVSDQVENTVRKVSPDGTDLGVFASGLGSPWGLAFDASGLLYVAGRAGNVITRHAADGTSLGVFASTGLDQPIGIAFDAHGNLFVANFGSSTIRKFSSAGSDLGIFASSNVSHPTEITFDDAGNLYVANWGAQTVSRYAADGTDLGNFVTGLTSQPQGIAIRKDPVAQPTYSASIQQPVKDNGSSVFNARRGVVPVKFTLALNGEPTCALPAATISLQRTAGGTLGAINESEFVQSADFGSNFRIDLANCQYVYNLGSASLGVGTYLVTINIANVGVGMATFSLK
jgi:sugar lactone lactonase YvrE